MPAIDLGYRPRKWQYLCHTQMTRYTVLALHRRAGKTELALAELVDSALQAPRGALALFAYIAPFLNQATRIVWRRLKAKIEPLRLAGRVLVHEQEKSVEFTHNGARITLFGADNTDAIRGVALWGAVLDEVAQMPPELWEDVVYPALQDNDGWALFIGTPQGVDLFYELFMAAKGKPDWSSAVFTVFDTGVFTDAQIENIRSNVSESSFKREWLCDFTASGVNQLLSLVDVEEAATRAIDKLEVAWAPRLIGVDPARYGDDKSVIIRRQGLAAFKLQAFAGIDNMALASRVAAEAAEWEADAIFVDAGAGSGVIDRLRQLKFTNVFEVNFGGKPSDPIYTNKRAEMWHRMARWVTDGGVIPNDQELKRDLAALRYSINERTNKREIETKDELKERGLPSPDRGDALALTFAEIIAPTRTEDPVDDLIAQARRKRVEYNPLADNGRGVLTAPRTGYRAGMSYDPFQRL